MHWRWGRHSPPLPHLLQLPPLSAGAAATLGSMYKGVDVIDGRARAAKVSELWKQLHELERRIGATLSELAPRGAGMIPGEETYAHLLEEATRRDAKHNHNHYQIKQIA